ncbi:MAG TPA: response regulator [Opitutaceae bacterium]|jgi:two-component system chemotaxis response regulator CheY
MRLLVVDDSKTMRNILIAYLRGLGSDVSEADDGQNALNLLANDIDFDAMLIDWDMPRMNGLELLRQVRSDPRCDAIKTMMVTSQTSMEYVTEALTIGADDYLMKPLDEEMLAGKLRLLGLLA